MIFKLMVNFRAGDTWKTIFLTRDTGGSKEKKSDPSCVIVKTWLFLKNNNSADTNPIRSESDPESNPVFVQKLASIFGHICS